MGIPTFEVLSPGMGGTVQDGGRPGWRRFGVPPGGCMDREAAFWANRLLDNPPKAPLLEFLWRGARLLVLHDAWIAITGAEVEGDLPMWRTLHVRRGDKLAFPDAGQGLWIYVAVEGGITAPLMLGSASAYTRGGFGRHLAKGDILEREHAHLSWPSAVAGRFAGADAQRDYSNPPALRVWRGPQWDWFSAPDRELFFASEWTVTAQCDRVGYRLSGSELHSTRTQMLSEPVRVGSIQVPENGQPIVTMRDGPTVGGYPKLGMVDPADLSWLAQCQPGQTVRFEPISGPK